MQETQFGEIRKELEGLPEEQIANLLKVIRIFKESVLLQREVDFNLGKELQEWDSLSDEALWEFEGKL